MLEVVAGDTAAALDYSSTSALTLNGGTISYSGSGGGISATLTLATPGAANSLSNNRTLQIDTTVPTISSSSPTGTTDSWGNAGRDVTFTMSEEIDAASLADTDLTVTAGTCAGPAILSSAISGAGNNVITFTLDVNACTNGQTYTLTFSSADVADLAGNVGTTSKSIVVTTQTAVPTLSLSAPDNLYVNAAGTTVYTVTYSGASSVTLADADVNFAGASTGCVATVTGSGLTTRTITISLCSDDGAVQIDIAADTAVNSYGNLAAAVAEAAITDFTADNTDLTDPTSSLAGDLYNSDTDSNFTLTFAGDVLGVQADLQSATTLDCNSNSVTLTSTRTSATVQTVAPNEASPDFTYGSTCVVTGTSVPDAAGNLHDYTYNFTVTWTPVSISGPSGTMSIGTQTTAGDLGDVAFNVDMDPTTVIPANATLVCAGNTIAITAFTQDPSANTYLIDFDETDANWTSLVGGETCVLTMSTSVTNSLGTPLAAPEVFTFATAP
jgi:hypothetical protein